MKNGYKIFWSQNALDELTKTIEYLEINFSEKELRKLALKLEDVIESISKSPNIYPESDYKKIHRAVILKFNTLYYRVKGNNIEILSFFSNRQNPEKRKM
ncbi:type II toxin-antitoxin system RelE/ParE family toxin [Elizabethkingia meningoseptica]|uniref:type II toxin-antitoxin system RelE/ParE family toxin n=1 Tax=Elizabethkingia meningoseptica TaxID=238 RepID=UPI003891B9F8